MMTCRPRAIGRNTRHCTRSTAPATGIFRRAEYRNQYGETLSPCGRGSRRRRGV